MEKRRSTRIADLIRERDNALVLLLDLERQIAEFCNQRRDLLIEVAEAEERGQWTRIAQLRGWIDAAGLSGTFTPSRPPA